ncbi:hypothetical protein bwei_3919 [Bacillus mycoides]|nr:hypothetical protein bwei_3919 [Bacillus mycoides]
MPYPRIYTMHIFIYMIIFNHPHYTIDQFVQLVIFYNIKRIILI